MQMTTMDILFVLVLVLLFARAARSIAAGQRAELIVQQPGKIIANALLFVVFALALFLRRASISMPFVLLAGGAACIAADFFVKNGFCADGLIYAGKTVPYSDMVFATVETENEKELYVRINTAKRDYGMKIAPADKEKFLARMQSAKIEVRYRESAEGGGGGNK